MFSNLTVGFLAGAGLSAFIYSKMMRSTGGNLKNALIVSAVAGVFVMVLVATVLSMLFKSK